MATRNIVRVLPKESNWKVTYNSVEKKVCSLKSDAVSYGTDLAKANKPSQLVVHNSDGTIAYEYTYGDDPYPPKG